MTLLPPPALVLLMLLPSTLLLLPLTLLLLPLTLLLLPLTLSPAPGADEMPRQGCLGNYRGPDDKPLLLPPTLLLLQPTLLLLQPTLLLLPPVSGADEAPR